MTVTREITHPAATGEIARRALAAHEAISILASSLVTLRNALDRGDPGEIFDSLTAFETAAGTVKRRTDAVTGEAIDHHGYF